MKTLITLSILAIALTGCNTATKIADQAMNKQSSFSQKENTIYPTIDGKKDGEPADFAKQQF